MKVQKTSPLKRHLTLIGLCLLYFGAGMVACRGGQKMVEQNFEARMEACVERAMEDRILRIDEVFQCQAEAMPSKIIIKIFFW